MTRAPEFRLLPVALLSIHEEVDPEKVEELAREIAASGVVREPIWVAEGSNVILNGHHRFAALRRLGAERIPAWVVAYDDPRVRLERWTPGPALSKSEVVDRARSSRPFPPKTTKHSLPADVPSRPTPLSDLLPPAEAAGHRPTHDVLRRPSGDAGGS